MFVFDQLDAHTAGIARADAKAEKAQSDAEDAQARLDVEDARRNVWAMIVSLITSVVTIVAAELIVHHFTK